MRMIENWMKHLKLIPFQIKWRGQNSHNHTYANNIFPLDMVQVGNHTYGPLNVIYYGQLESHLEIGNFCSISAETKFLLAGEHDYKCISTFPMELYLNHHFVPDMTRGPVVVEDDVWIGHGATILSGVKIGRGGVIGAGSIVTKDIPPYAVYAGNKVIKYRFREEIIRELMNIDYSRLSVEKYGSLREEFQSDISQMDAGEIKILVRKINE